MGSEGPAGRAGSDGVDLRVVEVGVGVDGADEEGVLGLPGLPHVLGGVALAGEILVDAGLLQRLVLQETAVHALSNGREQVSDLEDEDGDGDADEDENED